jgi:GT2 family glycosyltransferase
MDLSIIILNYNTKELTLTCLKSIVDQYKEDLEKDKFEIILVDNGSTDKSPEAFNKLKINNLKIIESSENLGFSRGCNLGAKNSKGNLLLFLNSDTQIRDQGFKNMVEYLSKNDDVGILGGKLKNEDGTSQPSTGKFYNLKYLFLMLLGFEKKGFLRESPKTIKKVDWVSGACLMIKKKVFDKAGGFDKELFMYVEDMDLCYKALEKGFYTYFFPEIILFHKERGSSNKTFAILNIYKGILHFYEIHKSRPSFLLAKLMLKTKAWLLVVLGKIMNNKYLTDTYSQALKI